MKKIILGTLLSSVLAVHLVADCNIINFGSSAVNPKVKLFGAEEKVSGQVVDYQVVYATQSRFYRDSDNKLQLKAFNDAYGEFFKYMKSTAIEECKTNKYQGVVNVDIKYVVDENNFFFSATYNYIN